MFQVDYKYIYDLYKLKDGNYSFSFNNPQDYSKLHDLFDKLYNLNDYNISFDLSCTRLINRLFDYYVDDKTLVLSSAKDHPSVQNCLSKVSNWFDLLGVDIDVNGNANNIESTPPIEVIYKHLIDRLRTYDYTKIFIISYGTHVSNGEVRDNEYFKKLKSICDEFCNTVIMVLDDCQGSLWINRDYSIFDYVLWTAHATLGSFDAGILYSKSNLPTLGIYNIGEDYLYSNYKELLRFSDFCLNWNRYLTKATDVHISKAPHIFSIKSPKIIEEKYFKNLQLNSNATDDAIAPINVDGNRFIRLRVEKFLGRSGRYLLQRALQLITSEINNDN